MDASTRWETAAIRSGSRGGSRPPRPTAKRQESATTWVTLKEAEAATSVPVNTLRKWIRKAKLPSYLESDGDIALRMVDLEAVVSRARHLGRRVEPLLGGESDDRDNDIGATETGRDTRTDRQHGPPVESETASNASEGTMIVPIDAFNKMLSQLGNLHEAGQQLAEARERAAKAETEAIFLRQRLAELRSQSPVADVHEQDEPSREPDDPIETIIDIELEEQSREPLDAGTTTYWRYLTTGWAERRRLRRH
ncbi:MAG: hypothetical protein ACC654_01335 [Acidimicrobiia bacterium]